MKRKNLLIYLLFFSAVLLLYLLFFRESSEMKNRIAVEQQLADALDQAESVWIRPALMEGAGRDFTRLEEEELLMNLRLQGEVSEADGRPVLTNEHAVYRVTILSSESLILEATPLYGSDPLSVTLRKSGENWIRDPNF